jgi:APA family basic amino acid/polyamine antiporter
MSAVMVLIGVVLLVSTLARGGGPLAIGVLLGLLFVAAARGACTWPGEGLVFRRGLGQPALFAIIYTSVASAIYFSLGVVAARALGLTPVVYVLAGIFFALACTTYVEGASLHQDRGGATVFARYAFNELVSFVAGWMILLDYIILIAVTSFSATNYLAAFYSPLGGGTDVLLPCFAIIAYVAIRNIRGFSKTRVNRIAALVVADLGLQALVIVLGLFAFFHLDTITDTIHFGDTPTWGDTVFALGVATVSFTGLESASGLSGEVAVGRRGLKRLVGAAAIIVMVVYTGIGIVAVTALPVVGNATSLGRNFLDAPMIGIAEFLKHHAPPNTLKYTIVAAAATLIAAANSAMMGLSRLAYSLSTNRQIPSAVGRLHPTRSTPYVVITIAALLAAGLTIPQDLELMVGIFAYGALVGLTIAHLSIMVLRYKEPDGRRPYRIPFGIRFRGGDLPLLAVIGGVLSAGAWVGLVVTHGGARWVAPPGGRRSGAPICHRRSCGARPRGRAARQRQAEYGSLVPSASPWTRDIIQLPPAGPEEDVEAFEKDKGDDRGAVDLEVPMSPIDAALPEARSRRAPRWRAPRRWGRSTRGSRSPPRPSARAAQARPSSTRPSAAACRPWSWPPRSRRRSAAGRCWAGAAARWTTSWGRRPSTCCPRRRAR